MTMRTGAFSAPVRSGSSAGLLAGVGLLLAGVGLLQSLVGLRASAEGFGTVTVGVLMSGYFSGYLTGSVAAVHVVAAVGHIRAFAAFGALASATFLAHGMLVDRAWWFFLRLVAGVCVAGLVVVAESWLNGISSNDTRGVTLSRYMMVSFAGLGAGQLLLNVDEPERLGSFALVAILVSVSTVPVVLTTQPTPKSVTRTPMSIGSVARASPVALVAAVTCGLAHSAIVTLGALYASDAGLSHAQTSAFVATIMMAAMMVAIPLGRLSDRLGRRRLLVALAAASATASVPGVLSGDAPGVVTIVASGAGLGALTYALYPIALAELNDRLDRGEVLDAGAKLVLVYSVGAVLGPVAASALMGTVGPAGFWWHQLSLHVALGIYGAYRLTRRAPIESRSPFAPLPSGATPAAVGLTFDDVARDATSRYVDAGDATLYVVRRGAGPPIVLIHDLDTDSRIWQHVHRPLARAGLEVVDYDLRGHGRSSRAPRYRLEDHLRDLAAVVASLESRPVHLVGHGFGGLLALAHAVADPRSVSTLALVSCADTFPPSPGPARLYWRSVTATDHAVDHVVDRRRLARRHARTHYDPRDHPDRYQLVHDMFLAADPDAADDTVASLRLWRTPRAPTGVPMVVVVGERDRSASPARLEELDHDIGSVFVETVAASATFPSLDNPHALSEVVASHVIAAVPDP